MASNAVRYEFAMASILFDVLGYGGGWHQLVDSGVTQCWIAKNYAIRSRGCSWDKTAQELEFPRAASCCKSCSFVLAQGIAEAHLGVSDAIFASGSL
eukprot:525040-Pyramimonas_sp.AAC.1